MALNLIVAESMVLDQVKFINFVLEECRRRNKDLSDVFGASYGKLIGVGTVYEEAIHSLRQVKTELEKFLALVRDDLRKQCALGDRR